MGFIELDPNAWKAQASRTLIVGPPNTFKTTSIATWPRPIHWVSFPGEKGSSSIPVKEEGIKAYVWQEEDYKKFSPVDIIKAIEAITIEILTGARGECVTFAGDGVHKLYEHFFQQELHNLKLVFGNSSDPKFQGMGDAELEEALTGKAYGAAHREFIHYLNKVSVSKVPNVVMTIWDGAERDDAAATKGPSHIFPDLPGKMAKRIMGEFAVVLYSEVSLPDPQGNRKGTWQLRPGGKVWGAGVKVPPDIAKKLPEKVEQNWAKLHPLLMGEVAIPVKPTPQLPKPITT